MVFYRDRGDNFITKQISLTTNLDAVYTDLLEIEAEGGGDSPESVNQALNEAVGQMKWSNDQNTIRPSLLWRLSPTYGLSRRCTLH